MTSLRKDLRKLLEDAVKEARRIAEAAAAEALQALAVGEREPFAHLSPDERKLRNRLRARGRAAGDAREAGGRQSLTHLLELVAYEHWHRMLFARYLAENGLLLDPEHGVALSLADIEDLAREERRDLWDLAGTFAQALLPGVFRNDDAALEVTLAPEHRRKLEKLLASLDPATFTADDSLGWTYQFWQAERKDAVNASGNKIGADELSPVTQLFTEDYMVEFLLHNTIGAWWAGRCASGERGKFQVETEEQARAAVSLPPLDGLPGLDWTYLRFIQDEETKTWQPAAGTFPGWPSEAKDLTFLDPCMGSGHFLVFALPVLARLRREEEDLSAAGAVTAVIRDNLHGLELDARCCQIAAFNLALTAWKLAGHQDLPALQLACCGLAPRAAKEDWVALAGESDRLQRGMERLYKLFGQAPVLGSLINPRLGTSDLLEAGFEDLQPLLAQAVAAESQDESRRELTLTAQGVAKAAELLAGQYTLVLTNVPYLARGKQGDILRDYIERHHKLAKTDLATAFVERCLTFCRPGGSTALVTPQNWLFLTSYKHLRKGLLEQQSFNWIARLGEHGFQSSSAAGAFTALFSLTRSAPDATTRYTGLDVSAEKSPQDKATRLASDDVVDVNQESQLENPDWRVGFEEGKREILLNEFAVCIEGLSTGDGARFILKMWEIGSNSVFEPFVQNVTTTSHHQGRSDIVRWNGENSVRDFESAHNFPPKNIGATKILGNRGIRITQMRELSITLYEGEIFGKSGATLTCENPDHLPAIWCFCSSPQFNEEVRKIDQKLNVTNATLVKVPFDLEHWQRVAAEKYPDGLPEPYSDDPTQWLFKGRIDDTPDATKLHVAVARLLGYRWPAELDAEKAGVRILPEDEAHWDKCAPHADEDGIVCLPALNQEAAAAERLRQLLDTALGRWDEPQLLAATGTKKKTLEDWLRDDFFAQHSKLFHHRPFLWHLWDGRSDGFHALVNYHQLAAPDGAGHKKLETLTYSYLGDWIRRQQEGVRNEVPGAQDRLLAAQALQKELEAILAGEPPYDLFVRWKPLHGQAIGWHPDLNDGVRLNARPFLKARDVDKKDAGLFRSKPNLKWDKDRGKEPERPVEDFPWFWSWDEQSQDFEGTSTHDGNRWNDLHYTTAKKQKARDRKEHQS